MPLLSQSNTFAALASSPHLAVNSQESSQLLNPINLYFQDHPRSFTLAPLTSIRPSISPLVQTFHHLSCLLSSAFLLALIFILQVPARRVGSYILNQLMSLEENFSCPICLQYAKQAVQTNCCTKIFCLVCVQSLVSKGKSCACCRSSPLRFKPSNIARKIISEIKVPCQHCATQVQNGELNNHLAKCPNMKTKCKLCDIQLYQGEVAKHTAVIHQKQAKEYLIGYVLNKKNFSKGKVEGPRVGQSQDYFTSLNNHFNRKANIGTNSKYYCGGDLIGRCNCCDGKCGLTNGENCDACMELDIKRWKLANTFLINPDGYICQVVRIQGNPKVSCFRILKNRTASLFNRGQSQTCKPGTPCSSCACVQNSLRLGRYRNFY